MSAQLSIRLLDLGDLDAVLAAAHLFDRAPTAELALDFLDRPGHHLLVAYVAEDPVGFVSGIEVAHPDKRVEMLLFELGVESAHRRRGIGRALVRALVDLARELGCRAMWVPTEPDDTPAIATYRSAGADVPEAATILSWSFDD